MKTVFLIILTLFLASSLQAATIYKWVDQNGVVNFTDDYNMVPPSYRDKVEVETRKDIPEERVPLPAQAVTPRGKEEEIRTDIYGRDEMWWRDKVRPWKEQLKEATENYEKAQKNFTKKSEEMSQTNFYGRSRSQTKWDVMELNRLNAEKKKHEVQMNEAREAMEKISKEAKETKANPDWLK